MQDNVSLGNSQFFGDSSPKNKNYLLYLKVKGVHLKKLKRPSFYKRKTNMEKNTDNPHRGFCVCYISVFLLVTQLA
jgi:hypothetical protein